MADGPTFGTRINFKGGSAARTAGGQFATGATHEALRQLSQRLAEQTQADAVTNLQDSIERPQARTNRLARVTADPENVAADRFGYAVGIQSFLDDSMARYWRTIEEGSAFWGFKGRRLRFAFSKGQGHDVPFPVPHGATPGIRSAPDGSKKTFEVTHEIEPHHYYQRAWEAARPDLTFRSEAQRILSRALTTQITPGR